MRYLGRLISDSIAFGPGMRCEFRHVDCEGRWHVSASCSIPEDLGHRVLYRSRRYDRYQSGHGRDAMGQMSAHDSKYAINQRLPSRIKRQLQFF